MSKDCILSIVLPAYNEEYCIEESLNQIKESADQLNIAYEIIVVNDGSSDNTLSIINNLRMSELTVVTYDENQGKGYAVKKGMLAANGKWQLFMDVDLSTSLKALSKFMKLASENPFDIFIGNRKTNQALQTIRQPYYRRFFGEGFTQLSSMMVGQKLTDFTCGFKMFSKQASQAIFSRQQIFNWSYDTEIIYIALLHKFKIFEVPVEWKHDENSKVKVLSNIFTSLAGLFQMKINKLRGLYK